MLLLLKNEYIHLSKMKGNILEKAVSNLIKRQSQSLLDLPCDVFHGPCLALAVKCGVNHTVYISVDAF